ncbi:hypothetical protein QJS04_geneDACA009850 [Acorus gramineus]|uniref:Glycosyltransferase n=1 Tax=Acorus gramineus TaxID=55184 RepID=A0AAV9B8A9_ACOGR|nr:hypothetical protein QJS04_geneDACA009850 [Acorus gramineus]
MSITGDYPLLSATFRWLLRLLLFTTAAVFLYAAFYGLPKPPSFFLSSPSSPQAIEKEKLESVLRGAAMEDKTVILTMLNAAWASPNSTIDLFMESFRIGDGTRGLLEHLVIVAVDEKAYARCKSMHPHCYELRTEGVDFSGETKYMTPMYLKMMWGRLDFLRLVLELGYNFIFTDADIMWFRNPLPRFYKNVDFQIACDRYIGNPVDLRNSPNAGFKHVQSNNRTIEFYKFWSQSRNTYPGRNEQDVLNFIKGGKRTRKIGLTIRFLNTEYFGGFCEPSRDLNKVCTMHANCCVGLDKKLYDLRNMIEDWKNYMSMPPNVTKSHPPSWRKRQKCR